MGLVEGARGTLGQGGCCGGSGTLGLGFSLFFLAMYEECFQYVLASSQIGLMHSAIFFGHVYINTQYGMKMAW